MVPSTKYPALTAVLTVGLSLILVDAAVETFVSGSPVRWWVAGFVALYVIVGWYLWRRSSFTWSARLTTGLVFLAVLLTLVPWLPHGLTDGIRLLGQPTSRVLSLFTMAAIVLSGISLVRISWLPRWAKVVISTLILYALAAFLKGVMIGVEYPDLLHGQSLWTRLPSWQQGTFVGVFLVIPVALCAHLLHARTRLCPTNLSVTLALVGTIVIALAAFRRPDHEGFSTGKDGRVLQPWSVDALQLPVSRDYEFTHVQPEYFAAALGHDQMRIFYFVRDHIAYESYDGCLRGPRGTLLAMAGNSIDRAALLGQMLQASGQHVRFVRGNLSESYARKLVARMFVQRSPSRVLRQPPSPAAKVFLNQLASNVQRDYRLIDQHVRSAIRDQRRPAEIEQSLVKESSAHYWLQVSNGSEWVDLDPSLADAEPGQALAKHEAYFNEIPEAVFQRVSIRIRLEEYTGDAPSTREILKYASKAADLSGVDVVLAHEPENWKGPATSVQSAIASAVEDTGRVRPVLVLGPDHWVTGDPIRTQRPKAGGIGGIQGMLGGAGTRHSIPIATAEWIDFTFATPSGRQETVTRDLYDLVGKARRGSAKTLSENEVYALTEDPSSIDISDMIYDLFFTTGRIDPALLHGATESLSSDDMAEDVRTILRRTNLSMILLSDISVAAPVISYPDLPRLVITEISLVDNKLRFAIDLRCDSARAVDPGFDSGHRFLAQVFRGVVDGTLERLVGEIMTHQASADAPWPTTTTASLVFERVQAAHLPIRLLTTQDPGFTAAWPNNASARLQEDIAQGYWVVVPEKATTLDRMARLAWWRINPKSGETVAVVDDGLYGFIQVTQEYNFVVHSEGRNATTLLIRVGNAGQPAQWVARFSGGLETLGQAIEFLEELGGDYILNVHPYP